MSSEESLERGKSASPLTRADVEQILRTREPAARIDFSFHNLQRCDLSYLDLQGANLRGANFQAANLRGTNLSKTDLQEANLSDADLDGADLSNAHLGVHDGKCVTLHRTNLSYTTLRGLDLHGFDLTELDLHCADLNGTDLRHAVLHGTNLQGADLSTVQLHGPELRGAILYRRELWKTGRRQENRRLFPHGFAFSQSPNLFERELESENLLTISSLLIRPSHSPDELTDHLKGYVEVAQSFSPDPFPEDTVDRLRHKLITLPGYRPKQVRSVYRNGEHVGGYRMYERVLRVGVARLVTGCIGGVYTRANARNQGVATALMHDAITYAQAHQYPLLLLDGIPKFYHRYGYCDVYDVSTRELDRQAILALSESPYTVRRSRLSDATHLLALYEHHLGLYTGSFERSIEQQTHWMRHLEPEKLLVAIDPADQGRGDLFFAATQARGSFFLAGTQLWELVVDDWPAAVALLQYQYHARLVEREVNTPPPETFLYSIPPLSPLANWLVENLEVGDISTWDMPVFGWAVREQTFHHRHAGWMARLVNVPALVQAMLPEWQARWQRSLAHWSGDVSLMIGDEAFAFRIEGSDLQLLATPSTTAKVLLLTPQAFTQVVFGFYPIGSVLPQRGHSLPSDLATVLTILFPTGRTWIPPSDWF